MDPSRINAFLQAACAGLGFDIGEVWLYKNKNNDNFSSDQNHHNNGLLIEKSSVVTDEGIPYVNVPLVSNEKNKSIAAFQKHDLSKSNDDQYDNGSLKFVQLYTSKAYDVHRSKLVFPNDSGSSSNNKDHILSPCLINAICKHHNSNAKVIWANSDDEKSGSTQIANGLLGRSDVLLRTAIGMPFAVDKDGNTCVVVMFSPYSLKHSDDAIDHLKFISLSATNRNIPCLLPLSEKDDDSFHQLKNKINSSKFNGDTFSSINQKGVIFPLPTNNADIGNGVKAHFLSFDRGTSIHFSQSITESNILNVSPMTGSLSPFDIPRKRPRSLSFDDTPFSLDDDSNYAVWSTIMNTELIDSLTSTYDSITDFTDTGVVSKVSQCSLEVRTINEEIDLYKDKLCRLEEFALGFLGMSVFDIADIWMPENSMDENVLLKNVLTVSKDPKNDDFLAFEGFSRSANIPLWTGTIGRAFVTFQTVWNSKQGEMIDPNRVHAFYQANIKTAVSVPVLNESSKCMCVLSFYSQTKVESSSCVVNFIEKAIKLVWCGLEKVASEAVFDEKVWEEINSFAIGKLAANETIQTEFSRKRSIQSLSMIQDIESSCLPTSNLSQPMMMSSHSNYSQLLQTAHSLANNQSFSKSKDDLEIIKNSAGVHHYNSINLSRPGHNPVTSSTVSSSPTQLISTSPNNINRTDYVSFDSKTLPIHNGQINPMNATMNNHSYSHDVQGKQSSFLPNFPTMAVCGLIPNQSLPPVFRTCKVDGCDVPVYGKKPYCIKHKGDRKCEHNGCSKCAQGTTRFCIAHGGGRRCTYPGCDKGARDKSFCAAHGGGKRCTHPECSKSAVGGLFCTAHGGGKRCSTEGCNKAAQASTKFCVAHGGGRKCSVPDCEKVARGKTKFCASHGGSVICRVEGCTRAAIRRSQLCRKHGLASNSAERRSIVSPF